MVANIEEYVFSRRINVEYNGEKQNYFIDFFEKFFAGGGI